MQWSWRAWFTLQAKMKPILLYLKWVMVSNLLPVFSIHVYIWSFLSVFLLNLRGYWPNKDKLLWYVIFLLKCIDCNSIFIHYSRISFRGHLELASNSGFRPRFVLQVWIFLQNSKTKSRIEGLGSRMILNTEGTSLNQNYLDGKVSILQRNYTVTVFACGTVPAAHFTLY